MLNKVEDGFGRVDWRTTTDADNDIGISFFKGLYALLDPSDRGVLANLIECGPVRVMLFKDIFDTLYNVCLM